MSAHQGSRTLRVSVAYQIRTLRMKRGMTQEDLSDATGISRGHLSAIEKARCNVRLDSLEKIARALGVPISYLVDDRIIEGDGRTRRPPRRIMEQPAAYDGASPPPGRRVRSAPGTCAAPFSA